MNAWVLNNPLAQFCFNEQKSITRAKRHTFLEWDRFSVYLQYTPKVLKLALVKLTFNHILQILGMTTWGVGAIFLNVQAKLESNEDLTLVIRMTQAKYAKELKGAWMEHEWKFASNKIV
jgi:hypothetical protein